MIVFFEGRFSKKKQDLICNLITFSQDKLFPQEDDVTITIKGIRKDGVCGDVMFEDENDFTMRLDNRLDVFNLIVTVLHEMVHVSQYVHNYVMDHTSDYCDRWQEIEAFEKEKELADQFHNYILEEK